MPRPIRDLDRLTLFLQSEGIVHARRLAEALRVSPSTLSRLIKRAGHAIERIGAARNTRYALRRQVSHRGSEWPVYRIDNAGRAQDWGRLRALHGGFRFIPLAGDEPGWMRRTYPDGIFPGLPFFLQDVRPQGYIGRAIARDGAIRFGVPSDLRLWNDDDILSYLLAAGHDLPGDIVVGDQAIETALRQIHAPPGTAVPAAERDRIYPELADSAQRGERVGSSAGGEQPKFLAATEKSAGSIRAVLVKFSSADPSPVAQRWADLLLCESIAAEVMRARGNPCARSEILDASGRRFLEVERFDRNGTTGRRGVLSLGAFEDAFLERGSNNWAAAASLLEAEGWIDATQARALRWIWCFGDLIANNDMHRGNVSIWFDDAPPYQLAPCYDMLPMVFAPGPQGVLSDRPFAPGPPLPASESVWSDAAAAAIDFWERVTANSLISPDFRQIARQCGLLVQRMTNQ